MPPAFIPDTVSAEFKLYRPDSHLGAIWVQNWQYDFYTVTM
jgi:hypothetical protein